MEIEINLRGYRCRHETRGMRRSDMELDFFIFDQVNSSLREMRIVDSCCKSCLFIIYCELTDNSIVIHIMMIQMITTPDDQRVSLGGVWSQSLIQAGNLLKV